MTGARYIVGDVFDTLAGIPDGSVDLVLTSPPFLALRSYLPADHPDKAKELGSEPTPGAYIDTLCALTEEWARVLAPHGSICIELGDTYSGSGGAGGDYNDKGMRELQPRFDGSGSKHRMESAKPGTNSRLAAGAGWPLDKSLCLIPELYRISLVYGQNPLTGRTTPPWRARNVIRWCRPNPPVGALGDKVRPATSDMVVACKGRRRYFDLDAVRTDAAREGFTTRDPRMRTDVPQGEQLQPERVPIGASAPPLDHWWVDERPLTIIDRSGRNWWHDTFDQDAWLIPTQPYKGAHYATWPEDLCIKPIEAMCPRRVCTVCGEPSERIVEVGELVATESTRMKAWDRGKLDNAEDTGGMAEALRAGGFVPNHERPRTTTGWSDCGHGDNWRPGLILDPFAGSGTTLAVAVGHGRDAIGIDIDARNADLARQRIGMFVTIEGAPAA